MLEVGFVVGGTAGRISGTEAVDQLIGARVHDGEDPGGVVVDPGRPLLPGQQARPGCVRAVGARPVQVFFLGVWPAVLPQLISIHFYIWEYNIRDSTVLGLVGAGGLGLLVSEAISLFQWSRLATILIAIIAMVTAFDSLSRAVRSRLL